MRPIEQQAFILPGLSSARASGGGDGWADVGRLVGERGARRSPVKAARRIRRFCDEVAAGEQIPLGDQAAIGGMLAGLIGAERCTNCGRKLSNERSRKLGIGPDCLADLGGARRWRTVLAAFVEQEKSRARAAEEARP